MFWFNGQNRRAHRVAWLLTQGPIPDDFQVVHRCKTPHCVNPWHLSLGTTSDANGWAFLTGRRSATQVFCLANGACKLDPRKVYDIEQAVYFGVPVREIAADFEISCSNVRKIGARQAWRHCWVGLPPAAPFHWRRYRKWHTREADKPYLEDRFSQTLSERRRQHRSPPRQGVGLA